MHISDTNVWKAVFWCELGSDKQVPVWQINDGIKIKSNYFYDPVEVQLIAENDYDKQINIQCFDLKQVETILEEIDFYIEKSIMYIKSELLSKPELFGLKISDTEKYKDITVEDFPVAVPFIYFYPNGSWMLEFKYANGFPTVEPGLGIGVFYNSQNEIKELLIPDKIEEDEIFREVK